MLIAMINALNDNSKDFDTIFGQYFDKSNYLTWLATNILMGNRDTINQNFALYQPKDSELRSIVCSLGTATIP